MHVVVHRPGEEAQVGQAHLPGVDVQEHPLRALGARPGDVGAQRRPERGHGPLDDAHGGGQGVRAHAAREQERPRVLVGSGVQDVVDGGHADLDARRHGPPAGLLGVVPSTAGHARTQVVGVRGEAERHVHVRTAVPAGALRDERVTTHLPPPREDQDVDVPHG